MKILVPFKRVYDTTIGECSASDSGQWVINPFDEIAIEEAMQMREREEVDEVLGVTIAGPEGEEQIRAALAMGIDRAVRINDARVLDSLSVAKILREVVRREEPALVLMGKQAVDDDACQAGQMLAGLLSWPQATFISRIELERGANQAQCARETDAGLEIVNIDLPAVVTADLRLNEPRYVSLTGLIKARRRPIEVLDLDELGVKVESSTSILKVEPAPKRKEGIRLDSIDELVERLKTVDKVL